MIEGNKKLRQSWLTYISRKSKTIKTSNFNCWHTEKTLNVQRYEESAQEIDMLLENVLRKMLLIPGLIGSASDSVYEVIAEDVTTKQRIRKARMYSPAKASRTVKAFCMRLRSQPGALSEKQQLSSQRTRPRGNHLVTKGNQLLTIGLKHHLSQQTISNQLTKKRNYSNYKVFSFQKANFLKVNIRTVVD